MFKETNAFSSFSVNDIEQAKEFYQNKLGLEVKVIRMGEHYTLLELYLSGGAKVMVYPKPDHVPASYTVLNFQVDNIEQTVDELTKLGVQFEHYDMENLKSDEKGIVRGNGMGPDIAWFTDFAGNIISVLENR